MKLGAASITSVAVAVAAVASSIVVIGTRHRATTSETDARAKNLLPVWRENEIERIELENAAAFTLERRAGDGGEKAWYLRSPVAEPADAEAVEKLVAELGFATPVRGTDQPAAALGITPKSPTIELWSGATHYRLRLGREVSPPEGAHFLELEGEGAPGAGSFVVTRETAALFASSASDFRLRSLWPLGPQSLRALTLQQPNAKLELTRESGGAFTLDGGQRAGREALEPIFAALSRATVSRFLDLPRAEAALAAGQRVRVRGVPAEGAPVTLEFGGSCPEQPDLGVVVRREPQPLAGCVERSIAEKLGVTRAALLDQRVFSLHADEVEELSLEREGKSLVLARKGSGFLLRKPAEAEIALAAGTARLSAILDAQSEVVADPDLEKLGLAKPTGSVTMISPGDGKAFQEVVSVGKATPDGRLPLRRQDGVVLLVPRDAARALSVDSTLLRSLELLKFSAAELVSVRLDAPEAQKLVRTESGTYELSEPKGFQVDGSLATDVALGLGALSAVRWVADADDGSFGLEKPRIEVEVEYRQGATSRKRTLRVGNATSGGDYARFTDEPGVFVIEREVVERLSSLLVDRSAFVVDPSSIARLELRRGGKKLVLIERSGSLAALDPPDLPPEQVRAIDDALSALRADAALHSGPARAEEGFSKPELEIAIERRAGRGPNLEFTIGAADSFRGLTVAYARTARVNATFVIARSKLRPLLDAFQ